MEVDRWPPIANSALVFRVVLSLAFLAAACGPVHQPESAKTVAAFEVPVATASDRLRLLKVMSEQAKAVGFHVDAASDDELKATSEISPQTFNATVWRGENDGEPVASAMDFQDRLGRVWISFSLGEDPDLSRRFRGSLMAAIKAGWPATTTLPIMPSGSIPLTRDLIRTANGYIVNPAAAAKYQAPAD